ncbi:unnamed protein product, partial [Porites evermanni]
IKAEHTVKRITFTLSEANPGETLHVHLPKLNSNKVIMPGSLALRFSFVLAGGNANNFLVQNILRALVNKFTVKYAGTTLQDTSGYDIYKCFEVLFLPLHVRCNNIMSEQEAFNELMQMLVATPDCLKPSDFSLLQVDPWREVMVAVTKEMEKHKTNIRCGLVDIHQDQAIVERFNSTLAEFLFRHQYAVKMRLPEGQMSSKWVIRLPAVVSALNGE